MQSMLVSVGKIVEEFIPAVPWNRVNVGGGGTFLAAIVDVGSYRDELCDVGSLCLIELCFSLE